MIERLRDKINLIHSEHQIPLSDLRVFQKELENWIDFPKLIRQTQIDILRGLKVQNGIEPIKLERSFVVHPRLIMVDERIPTLCWHLYKRPDGRLLACGGVRHKRSACPPYAPSPDKTRIALDESRAVVVIQAGGLSEYDQQRQLHRTLLSIEKQLEENAFNVIHSWSVGPCRICEPENECLGEGKCREPKFRRFSMEGSGMGVFLTCDRIAELTGDNFWRLELIDNWELNNQTSKMFKSVVAIAVGLRPQLDSI